MRWQAAEISKALLQGLKPARKGNSFAAVETAAYKDSSILLRP
jgi:hypothetical protein